MDRRTFLRAGSAGAIAVATGLTAHTQDAAPEAAPESKPDFPVVYRKLGRTGLKVSIISLGAFRVSEPRVMQAAFDRGVNYVDTARAYTDGRNEALVGKALKGYRDKVYVATKISFLNNTIASKDAIIACAEESLRQLGVDYIDVLQLHKPPKEAILTDAPLEALAQLKKQGKTRFVGVTTHSDEVAVIDTVLNDPDHFYDTILVTYNTDSDEEKKKAIARAAKAKLGVIAMKTQKGAYEPEGMSGPALHQAKLKYVLRDTNVACAIPSMTDLTQLREDTAVMGMDLELAPEEVAQLERYDDAIRPYYCRMCGTCDGTCPKGVDIHTVNRSLMYAEGYGDMALARATYAELPAARSAAACTDCTTCTATCAKGLDIPGKMRRARELFA